MTTKQDYLDWMKSEPLSDMCVDIENVGEPDDSADYWHRLLESGKQAVEGRKQEAVS
jgi:hypothetical protein